MTLYKEGLLIITPFIQADIQSNFDVIRERTKTYKDDVQ